MAKNKNKRAGKKKPVVSRARVPRRLIDQKALEYARLLADPCGAPLVHPVYAGGDAGFLFRAESVFTHGGAATETAGFVHWTPGYVNSTNTDVVLGAGASPSATITAAANGAGPGKNFLTNNAAAVRCVAACLKVTFPGAESARSGRIHYGHTAAGVIDATDTVTIDGLAPLLQHFSRTPPETIELVWRPGAADTEFNDPRASAAQILRDRKNSLTFAWAGIPVSTGMTFHYTAVYEWLPATAQGLSTNMTGKNTSRNTLDDVIDYIQATGFRWVQGAGHAAGMALGSSLVSGIASTFGIMPSRAMTYGVQRLMQ